MDREELYRKFFRDDPQFRGRSYRLRDDNKKVDISIGIQKDRIKDVHVYKTPIEKVEGEQDIFI